MALERLPRCQSEVIMVRRSVTLMNKERAIRCLLRVCVSTEIAHKILARNLRGH